MMLARVSGSPKPAAAITAVTGGTRNISEDTAAIGRCPRVKHSDAIYLICLVKSFDFRSIYVGPWIAVGRHNNDYGRVFFPRKFNVGELTPGSRFKRCQNI